MIVFGGHRLWHGFATDNSEANAWSSYDEYPKGGFLEDLWVYTKKQLNADELVSIHRWFRRGVGGGGLGGMQGWEEHGSVGCLALHRAGLCSCLFLLSLLLNHLEGIRMRIRSRTRNIA